MGWFSQQKARTTRFSEERLAYERQQRDLARWQGVVVHFHHTVKDAHKAKNPRLKYLSVTFHVIGEPREIALRMKRAGMFLGVGQDYWQMTGPSFDGRWALHSPVMYNSGQGWKYAQKAEDVLLERVGRRSFKAVHEDDGFMVESIMSEGPAPVIVPPNGSGSAR